MTVQKENAFKMKIEWYQVDLIRLNDWSKKIIWIWIGKLKNKTSHVCSL